VVAILILGINLWVQPACFREMRAIIEAVRADLAATMISPGQFTHPAPGLTVYAQSIDADGTIKNLFIDQSSTHGPSTTVMAVEGRFAARNGAPVLVLTHGSNQQLSRTGVLNTLSFDEYVFDLRPFLAVVGPVKYRQSDRYLHELFYPDPRPARDESLRVAMLAEGHSRLSSPLYSLAFTALALAAVLGGAFSRLGYNTRITVASGIVLIVRVVGFIATAASSHSEAANLLQYAAPAVCFLGSMLVVLRQHPVRRFGHPPAQSALAVGSAA
jgi:lipopolysaccharide export system permease protein